MTNEAMRTQHRTQHKARSTQHPARSTLHLALGTALGTQHLAPGTRATYSPHVTRVLYF